MTDRFYFSTPKSELKKDNLLYVTPEEGKIQQLSDFLKEMSADTTMLTQFV